MALEKKTSENIVGKGENAGNQHFLLYQQCFLPVPEIFQFFSHIYVVICKINALYLEQSKNLLFGKELNYHHQGFLT